MAATSIRVDAKTLEHVYEFQGRLQTESKAPITQGRAVRIALIVANRLFAEDPKHPVLERLRVDAEDKKE